MMNLFARALGGIVSDRCYRRWGLRGRTLLLGGTIALEGTRVRLLLAGAVAAAGIGCMMLTGLFIKMSNGGARLGKKLFGESDDLTAFRLEDSQVLGLRHVDPPAPPIAGLDAPRPRRHGCVRGRRALSPRALADGLALPLVLIVLLRGAPAIDREWEDQPAHFWIVLMAGVANAVLALAISEALPPPA